ncbi:hypothetical protein BB559_000348 [Furculomyces boomerangus]|uniref:Xylanolytic transcriptional activator regulatory domain-containing protein n=1 Tax=Furculomyces boomerangus TaxID=61424 RepID=A0A2T9Z5J9_9FUNG|nr:hypothetical protein BB559_000348 [Furculomyces boomerangus]
MSSSDNNKTQSSSKNPEPKLDFTHIHPNVAKELMISLTSIYPTLMLPIRATEFIYKLSTNLYPKYLCLSMAALYKNSQTEIKDLAKRKLCNMLIEQAIELLESEKNFKDPNYLWACCCIFCYTSGNVDNLNYKKASAFASKLSKIYLMDQKKKYISTKDSEEELEFKRRVWWVYYIFTRSSVISNGSLPVIEDKDILVNFPSKDFRWRYETDSIKLPPDFEILENNVNTQDKSGFFGDRFEFLIKSFVLFGSIALFLKNRWNKKKFDLKKDKINFRHFVQKIKELEVLIENMYPLKIYPINNIHNDLSGKLLLNILTEPLIIYYIVKQLHSSMNIFLYQSELVRYLDRALVSNRIIYAKHQCTDAAMTQSNMLAWFVKTIPEDYWETLSLPFLLFGAVVLQSYNFIPNHEKAKEYSSGLDNILQLYTAFGKKVEIAVSFTGYLEYIADFRKKAYDISKFDNNVHLMKPYAIFESDTIPWLAAHYGSYFFLACCFEKSFSTLNISEYLGLSEVESRKRGRAELEFDTRLDFEEFIPDTKLASPSTVFKIKKDPVIEQQSTNNEYSNRIEQFFNFAKEMSGSSPHSTSKYMYQYMANTVASSIFSQVFSEMADTKTIQDETTLETNEMKRPEEE